MTFPLLMRNLVGYLLPEAAGGLAPSVAAGDPVAHHRRRAGRRGPGDRGRPDRRDAGRPMPVTAAQYRFDFAQTETRGLYVVSQWVGARQDAARGVRGEPVLGR